MVIMLEHMVADFWNLMTVKFCLVSFDLLLDFLPYFPKHLSFMFFSHSFPCLFLFSPFLKAIRVMQWNKILLFNLIYPHLTWGTSTKCLLSKKLPQMKYLIKRMPQSMRKVSSHFWCSKLQFLQSETQIMHSLNVFFTDVSLKIAK